MRAILLIDFGSTYTKLTAADLDTPRILGHAQAFTTAASDISTGLEHAMTRLRSVCGDLNYEARLACSSAAGGLNMVACGLVPSLTSKAARLAAFGAGAKVIKTYAYQLTRSDIEEINAIKPDILLLSGGIDGGNSEVIIHNAGMLAKAAGDFPVVIAGNRTAQDECAQLLSASAHPVFRADNVMPQMNVLNIEPVAEVIRKIFMQRIILAKGLSRAKSLLDGILMPTPSAVLKALALLSRGQGKNSGIGDLLAVDLGGATTDVYSIAKGDPTNPTTVLRGLPEPVIKRTVEGDLGMRYNALGVLEAAGVQKLAELSGLNTQEVQSRIEQYHKDPALLPQGQRDLALDTALAAAATGIALSRHAGTLERVYTPVGPVYQQTGKDLSQTEQMIVTGGALIYASNLNAIISGALSMQDPMVLAPRQVRLAVDREYVLSAMGLLADCDQRIALCLLMEYFGREEAYAVV